MKIKRLEWNAPDVNKEDDDSGWRLAWEAVPATGLCYQVTAGINGDYEGWFMPDAALEVDADDTKQCQSVAEAKKWCEDHWASYAKQQILIYAEIEESDLR